MLSLGTFQAVPITNPPASWDGDLSPAYSPDGQKIAFVRALEGAVRDIYVLSVGNKLPPKRLTFDNRNIESLTWDKDSQSIIFSSDRGGKYSLWRVSLTGAEPQRLPMGTEDAFEPTVSHTGQRLAYAQSSAVWSILKYQLQPSAVEAKPTRVVSSTQQDSAPSYSPDGRLIAFQSWRSGAQEIWVASADGSNLEQITSFSKSLSGSPVWSPDGKQLAFDSRPEGRSHIYLVSPNGGGAPRAITDGNFNDILPRWSWDGRSIYFSSNRSGSWQIWKIAASGGIPQQITSGGGFVAAESSDGDWIYYTKPDTAGIWRIPSRGGSEVRVVNEPKVGYWGYWGLSKTGIYYLDLTKSKPAINFLNLTTGRTSVVLSLERRPPVYSGISICENESSLVITDESDAESHITLIEEFR
jgi:Tol biopolymer transport system component